MNRNTDVRDLSIWPDKKVVKPDKLRRVPLGNNIGRPMSPLVLGYVEQFRKFKPGQSFFVPDVKPNALAFLRRPFEVNGMGVHIRYMKKDEIYGVPGTRVFRKRGAYDDEL